MAEAAFSVLRKQYIAIELNFSIAATHLAYATSAAGSADFSPIWVALFVS